MKLTKREKTLWALVGIVGLLWLGYQLIGRYQEHPDREAVNGAALTEAYHTIRSEANIDARFLATNQHLKKMKERFLNIVKLDKAQIVLLKEVEKLTYQANLGVGQKNLIRESNQVIAVSLEGTAKSEEIIRFLQLMTTSQLALKVKRIQIHANPESRELKYQIIVETLLVEK